MATTLENMEDHAGTGAFGPVRGRYGPVVREQLLAISPATINSLLWPYKAQLQPDGISTTHSTKNQYRQAIPIMTRIPVIDRQPGLVASDTVAHCGLTANGRTRLHPRCHRHLHRLVGEPVGKEQGSQMDRLGIGGDPRRIPLPDRPRPRRQWI